jgi:hypothetical protein
VAVVVAGCYHTPRSDPPRNTTSTAGSGGASGSGGSAGGQAGTGGGSGSAGSAAGQAGSGGSGSGRAGSAGGQAGTGGGAGSGGGATGLAGTVGSGGSTGGSNLVFVGGPCVTTPDRTAIEVLARSSDGRILRRANDGANWGNWSNLPALDATMIDARSDLDCSATLTTVQVVASGLNPVGAVLRAFGFGTAYNPFARELPGLTFAPGPSIAQAQDGAFFVGVSAPGLFQLDDGTSVPKELTPITNQTDPFRSGPDIAIQPTPSMGFHYFAAFDATGALAIYYYVTSSSPAYWGNPVKLLPPDGSFAFTPSICTENGSYGVFSVNVVAVAGG